MGFLRFATNMQRLQIHDTSCRANSDRGNRRPFARSRFDGDVRCWFLFLLAGLVTLSACSGGSGQSQSTGSLAGNWQFAMTAPADNSFLGGVQGGFLLQSKGAVSGAVTYSVSLPPQQQGGSSSLCSSGSAPLTGTITGQNVTLTVVAGLQTFTLTGTLSAGGTTMAGRYASTDGNGCGTAQTGLQWTATSVPPLTGAIQGNFHSSLNPALRNQDFPVSGSLTQGENIGASNATVTGTLNFHGYPCLTTASVNGQISGSSVILQIIAPNGLNVGQIGAPTGVSNPSPVTLREFLGRNGLVLSRRQWIWSDHECVPGRNPRRRHRRRLSGIGKFDELHATDHVVSRFHYFSRCNRLDQFRRHRRSRSPTPPRQPLLLRVCRYRLTLSREIPALLG